MEIKDYERLICDEINKVVVGIIESNKILNISAKARAGAEISDWIEEKFVEKTQNHPRLKDTESAPKGKTKNPWDARTYFVLKNHTEEIWIDFKALKVSSADSNPDIGTPTKVINHISSGSFYLLYVHIYYQEHANGLEFVKLNNNFTKSYFLKDISHTFRRNPKNQLQVNMSKKPEYRSRKDFIKLLIEKIKESHVRQIAISKKSLASIDKTESELLKINSESEKTILDTIG
jgi:hypothetical protein